MSDPGEPLAAEEILLFARVLDESTQAGFDADQLLPTLDLFCAIARSDSGHLEINLNGRPAITCTVGDASPDRVAFELRSNGGHIGRILVAQPRSGRSWSEVDVELLTVLADLMAERFERSLAAETTRLAVVQLSAALESRVVLEQAKGMLAERHGGGLDDAFNSLRNAARQQRRTLREVAEEVVTRRADVAPKR